MKYRVVLDANVIVSGLITPQGFSGQLLKKFLSDEVFDVILSKAILEEISHCLFYPKVRKYIRLTDHEIYQCIAALEFLSDMTSGAIKIEAEIPDSDDKIYLAAAIEGQANYIVTGDSDLLGLDEFEEISIITPKTFCKLLSG